MRTVTGRLKSDYRYASDIVYNNFPWPGVTRETLNVPVEDCVEAEVKERIEGCARGVLEAREFYIGQAKDAGQTCSLADLYDPDNDFLYAKLTSAHVDLDKAVEAAYGVDFGGDEEKIVAHLFGLYEVLTETKRK